MQEIVPNLFLGPYASANKNKVHLLHVCLHVCAWGNMVKCWKTLHNLKFTLIWCAVLVNAVTCNWIHLFYQLSHLESTGITDIICVRHAAEANFIKPNFPEKIRYGCFYSGCCFKEVLLQSTIIYHIFVVCFFWGGGRGGVGGGLNMIVHVYIWKAKLRWL